MVYCSHKNILLDPRFGNLQKSVIFISIIDFFFNLTTERKVNGFIITPIAESALLYAKGWMVFDIISMIGLLENFNNKPLFVDFHGAIKTN